MSSSRNLTGTALTEAMIKYAISPRSSVYEKFAWKLFKLDHPCELTFDELFHKFWNEIIPNMANYEVVRANPMTGTWLACIPNPATVKPTTETHAHMTEKSLSAASKHASEREEAWKFHDLRSYKDDVRRTIQNFHAAQRRRSSNQPRQSSDDQPTIDDRLGRISLTSSSPNRRSSRTSSIELPPVRQSLFGLRSSPSESDEIESRRRRSRSADSSRIESRRSIDNVR